MARYIIEVMYVEKPELIIWNERCTNKYSCLFFFQDIPFLLNTVTKKCICCIHQHVFYLFNNDSDLGKASASVRGFGGPWVKHRILHCPQEYIRLPRREPKTGVLGYTRDLPFPLKKTIHVQNTSRGIPLSYLRLLIK